MNESTDQARKALTTVLRAMLDGELSYFEGAAQVLSIDRQLLGIEERDPDFDKFALIRSETDHLPLKAQQPHWSKEALDGFRDEFVQTEQWASSFAPNACRNLLVRFEVK